DDEVKVEEAAAHDGRKPGDVPAPDLVRSGRAMNGRAARYVGTLDLALGAPQPMPPLQPVHRRLRRQIQSLVGELGDELLRREPRVRRARHDGEHARFLQRRERVRPPTLRSHAAVAPLRPVPPSLDGASRDTDDAARCTEASAGTLCLGDGVEDHLSFPLSVSSSSSSSSSRWSTFFLRTSRAAASARAFSLRASSRSRLRPRFAIAAEDVSRSSRASRQRSNSASLTPSRPRNAVSLSPSRFAASATMRAFSATVHVLCFGRSEATIGRLRASASHRDRFCCRRPVSRASSVALTAFFPMSRSTIFRLKASEYGLVTA